MNLNKILSKLCMEFGNINSRFDWIDNEEDYNSLKEDQKDAFDKISKLHRRAFKIVADAFTENEGQATQKHVDEMKEIISELISLG